MTKIEVAIEGMTCGNCVRHVEKALGALDQVASYDVNLANNSATVELKNEDARQLVLEAIEEAGYSASLNGVEPKKK